MSSRTSGSACRTSGFLVVVPSGVRVSEIEVHSLIGHSDSVLDLIFDLRAPVDLVIHDYSWFCPRISLTAGDHRYCGEPAIAACRDCVAENGTNFDEPVSPDELIDRTRRLTEVARSIIAPSRDAARRIEKRFGRDVVDQGMGATAPVSRSRDMAASSRAVTTRAGMRCRGDWLRKGLCESVAVRPDGRRSEYAA